MKGMVAVCMIPAVFALSSCGRRTTPPSAGTGAQSSGTIDPYGDPRTYSGDPFAGFLEVITIDLPAEDSTAADSASTQESPPVTVPSSGQGSWCIQIAACSTQEDAARVAVQADPLTDLECDVESEPPWWKVRLGAFATREAAEARLIEVRALGYPDAWVVRRAGGD